MIQTPVSTGVIRPCTTLSTFFLMYLHNVHGLYYDSDPSNYIGQKKATFMLKGSLGYKLVWSHDQILWCSKAFWIDNVWSCGYQVHIMVDFLTMQLIIIQNLPVRKSNCSELWSKLYIYAYENAPVTALLKLVRYHCDVKI